MKNIVKTKKAYQCSCDEDGQIEDQTLVYIAHFNQDGNVVRQENYQDGEIATLIENEYDGVHLVKFQQTDYVYETQQIIESQYNDKGQKTEEIERFEGGGTSVVHFEYDEKGRLTKQYSKDEEDEIEQLIENTYDEHGNLLETKEYDTGDLSNPWITKTYVYDAKGNVLNFTEAYREQDAVSREYEYDEKGNMIYVQMYYTEDEELILEQKQEYDDAGQIAKREVVHYKEEMQRQDIFKHDKETNAIEMETQINGSFHSLRQETYNEQGDTVLEKELLPVPRSDIKQWTASSFEIEYWEKESAEEGKPQTTDDQKSE